MMAMADSPLAKKLQIRPGYRLFLVNAPPEYTQLLSPLPEGVETVTAGEADVVHLFARRRAEVKAHLPALRAMLKPGGVFWISWPKTTAGVETDLTRDVLWQDLEPEGLRPVSAVSVDAVWSALRFRPIDDVKPRSK
jgi:hypothetical protein